MRSSGTTFSRNARVERRVAEHRRDVDREVEQQPLHARRVVQHPLEQARRSSRAPSAWTRRQTRRFSERGRVLAEVEAVLPVDAFEQQLELERLEIQPPLGRLALRVSYLYSHTRISERSWSVSTGFVM